MKKFICFAITFLTSVLMFVATGLFIKLSTGMMEPLMPARLFIVVLNVICALKFALLIIMLVPGKPVLKQMSIGFISADVALLLLGSISNIGLSVPVSLIVAQALILLFYIATQGRIWIYKSGTANNAIENELVTSPIY
jgi:ABC-type methionine transport system permease subunit